jgi:hypothetical protein
VGDGRGQLVVEMVSYIGNEFNLGKTHEQDDHGQSGKKKSDLWILMLMMTFIISIITTSHDAARTQW